MLFNSSEFALVFLPISILGFFAVWKYSRRAALLWLVLVSMIFYAWGNPIFLVLLVASFTFNYFAGLAISRSLPERARAITFFAIACNLTCLGYFKYANFMLANANWFFGTRFHVAAPYLPLGISFFTFTQIAFLVDVYRGAAREYKFLNYALFVTYFPHLIAGPIFHHKEMIPQFEQPAIKGFQWENFAVGMSIFALGLLKKILLADTFATYSDTAFNAAGAGLNFFDAWTAALSFALQIYFDFSSYCDMAIGMSWIFGIRLPLNFLSPYKAVNIIEFWRTWHMTLSRFLRDYVYIPLGGNRRGTVRRYINLMLTMLIGGLWHGASWTFVIWGGLHGLYLVINHLWRALVTSRLSRPPTRIGTLFSTALTFTVVLFAWVFFRATDGHQALGIIKAMLGLNLAPSLAYRPVFPKMSDLLAVGGAHFGINNLYLPEPALPIIVGCAAIWLLPNIPEMFARYRPALDTTVRKLGPVWIRWFPNLWWAGASVLILAYSLLSMADYKPFIYFQF